MNTTCRMQKSIGYIERQPQFLHLIVLLGYIRWNALDVFVLAILVFRKVFPNQVHVFCHLRKEIGKEQMAQNPSSILLEREQEDHPEPFPHFAPPAEFWLGLLLALRHNSNPQPDELEINLMIPPDLIETFIKEEATFGSVKIVFSQLVQVKSETGKQISAWVAKEKMFTSRKELRWMPQKQLIDRQVLPWKLKKFWDRATPQMKQVEPTWESFAGL